MKIIHTADWHFNERDHDEIKKCVQFIVDYARDERPDLFIVSGDITDSRYLNLDSKSARTILNIFNRMLDIAPVAVVTGTPSHCGFSETALRECRGRHDIVVSDHPEQYVYSDGGWFPLKTFEGSNPDFLISQIPQPSKQYYITEVGIEDTDKAISEAMSSIFLGFGTPTWPHIPHIVNGHFQVGGAFISETQQLIGRDIEISTDQLNLLNADLICLGHIHKHQDFKNKDGFYSAFYSGSPTRMNFGETEDKGFYFHQINERGCNDILGHIMPNFITTPAKYMHNAEFDLIKGDFEDSITFRMCLESLAEGLSDDHESYDLKLTITTWQDEASDLVQNEIKNIFLESCCNNIKLLIIRKPRETVRSEKVLNADTLPNKLIAMGELRGEDISESVLNKAKALEDGGEEPWIK